MRTNVQKLRDLERWNVFEFNEVDNKYVPIFPFAMTHLEAYSYCGCYRLYPSCKDVSVIVLPQGCSF